MILIAGLPLAHFAANDFETLTNFFAVAYGKLKTQLIMNAGLAITDNIPYD